MVASRIWENPINENIPSSKDIVDGGWTKVLSRAQDIIRAHLVDAQRATNHLRPQLMNYLKTHSTMMRTQHKKLHRFLRMIIKKDRNLKQFRLLNQQNVFRELALEEAALMHLRRNFAQQTSLVNRDISSGHVSMFNKLSEIYVLQMQE